jgi:hypothetical protein
MAHNKLRNDNTVAGFGELLQLTVDDGIRIQRIHPFAHPSQTSKVNSFQPLNTRIEESHSVSKGIRTQSISQKISSSVPRRIGCEQMTVATSRQMCEIYGSHLPLKIERKPIPRVQIVYPRFTTCQLATSDPNATRAKIPFINTCKVHAPNRHNLIQLNHQREPLDHWFLRFKRSDLRAEVADRDDASLLRPRKFFLCVRIMTDGSRYLG